MREINMNQDQAQQPQGTSEEGQRPVYLDVGPIRQKVVVNVEVNFDLTAYNTRKEFIHKAI